MARIRPGTSDVVRLANPRTTRAQVRSNPAPTIVLLTGSLIALNLAKNIVAGGDVLASFSLGDAVKDVLLVGVFVFAGSLAPELVTWALLVALIFVLVTNPQLFDRIVGGLVGAFGRSNAAGG